MTRMGHGTRTNHTDGDGEQGPVLGAHAHLPPSPFATSLHPPCRTRSHVVQHKQLLHPRTPRHCAWPFSLLLRTCILPSSPFASCRCIVLAEQEAISDSTSSPYIHVPHTTAPGPFSLLRAPASSLSLFLPAPHRPCRTRGPPCQTAQEALTSMYPAPLHLVP